MRFVVAVEGAAVRLGERVVVVRGGELWAADDPVVRARPRIFAAPVMVLALAARPRPRRSSDRRGPGPGCARPIARRRASARRRR